jgi:hypothetical protein
MLMLLLPTRILDPLYEPVYILTLHKVNCSVAPHVVSFGRICYCRLFALSLFDTAVFLFEFSILAGNPKYSVAILSCMAA